MPTHVTRTEIWDLYHALAQVGKLTNDLRLSWTISHLRRTLKPHIEAITDVQTASDEFKDYEKAKSKLCADYAEKDAGGDPILVPVNKDMSKYKIDEKRSTEFQAKLKELNDKNKKVVDARNEQIEKLNGFMDEPLVEIDIDKLPKLPLSQFKTMSSDLLDNTWMVFKNDDVELQKALESGETMPAAEPEAPPEPPKGSKAKGGK